jgi:malate dehydrogenase
MGVTSDGNSYGVPEGIIYSFPVSIKPGGTWEIIKDLSISDFAREKMDATAKELESEKDIALQFLSTNGSGAEGKL